MTHIEVSSFLNPDITAKYPHSSVQTFQTSLTFQTDFDTPKYSQYGCRKSSSIPSKMIYDVFCTLFVKILEIEILSPFLIPDIPDIPDRFLTHPNIVDMGVKSLPVQPPRSSMMFSALCLSRYQKSNFFQLDQNYSYTSGLDCFLPVRGFCTSSHVCCFVPIG